MKTRLPPGLDDAPAFRQDGILVHGVQKGFLAPDHVIGVIGVGEAVKIPVLKGQQVIQAGLGGTRAGQFQFFFTDVGAGHRATEVRRQSIGQWSRIRTPGPAHAYPASTKSRCP